MGNAMVNFLANAVNGRKNEIGFKGAVAIKAGLGAVAAATAFALKVLADSIAVKENPIEENESEATEEEA